MSAAAWYLILNLGSVSSAVIVPQTYPDEDTCRRAAIIAVERYNTSTNTDSMSYVKYACIPNAEAVKKEIEDLPE
jgi:hypothetical protein